MKIMRTALVPAIALVMCCLVLTAPVLAQAPPDTPPPDEAAAQMEEAAAGIGEAIEAQMAGFEKAMDAWSEQFEARMEAWGKQFEARMEAWGKQLEAQMEGLTPFGQPGQGGAAEGPELPNLGTIPLFGPADGDNPFAMLAELPKMLEEIMGMLCEQLKGIQNLFPSGLPGLATEGAAPEKPADPAPQTTR